MSNRLDSARCRPERVTAMSERRVQPRRRVLKAGKILFANNSCTLDCTIRNISEQGAMLQIGHSVTVPDQFELYEPGRLTLHVARVVRRTGDTVGVVLSQTRSIAESTDPRLRRLKIMT
jgi:hypothetical protein